MRSWKVVLRCSFGAWSLPHSQNKPDRHFPLALDLDRAAWFAYKRFFDQMVSRFRDLYRTALAVRLHTAGCVHRIPPQIVGEFFSFLITPATTGPEFIPIRNVR